MILQKIILPLILVVFATFSHVNGLYEDQIGKFDWRGLHIGTVQQSHLELNGFQPRLLVSTRENVIASLCPKTGELIWRQILETGTRGNIKLLHVHSENGDERRSTAAARLNAHNGYDVMTVQGSAPALIRGWNANTGTIEWEWSLTPLHIENAQSAFWLVDNSILYHVLPAWKSHLEITPYFAVSGQVVETTQKIQAPWIERDECLLSGTYFVCLKGQELISVAISGTSAVAEVQRVQLTAVTKNKPKSLEGTNGVLIMDRKLVSVKKDIKVCNNIEGDSFIMGQFNQRKVIVVADVKNNILQIRVYDFVNCEEVPELSQNVPYATTTFGKPALRSFDCKAKRNNDGKGCLFLIDSADGAFLAVQQQKICWLREEALANVVATDFIDLPLADAEGTLEKEMKGKAGDIATAFLRRISTHMSLLRSSVLQYLGLGAPPSDTQKAGLVRDAFGLHKMLTVVTKSGKIFGIDNLSGKHHWTFYLEDASGFENDEDMKLVVQRTSKHFPLQPFCTLVARQKSTGNGLLYRFNPITGLPTEGGLLKLNYPIKQFSVLGESSGDFIKGLLVMTNQKQVYVYPPSCLDMADGMYFYSANKATAEFEGYYVSKTENQLKVLPVWNAIFSGHGGQHKVVAIASKNPNEHVHSQGRVLSDRSVLYKYINPNLVAVITQGPDSIHKFVLNIYLLDVVSGSVVFSMVHRKARGPVHVVHSENWLAYSFYNDKVRRTEITTMELYEGKTQANSTVWSSLNAPQMPLVERQTYIIPTTVECMRETITERGITNKDVLLGTSTGAIVELPWSLLDPRRPISTTQGREEYGFPYIPELPLPTENFINYNQTVARINRIYTAPSGLESTCLVVATGLDMFVTRVAPSKTFDQLKEDFDYILISVVLVALTSSSLIVKHLAGRKLIKQAWK